MKFLILFFVFTSSLSAADICAPDPAPRFSKYQGTFSDSSKRITLNWSQPTNLSVRTYAEPGPFGSYITLDQRYHAYKYVYEKLKEDYPNLKSRNEAHITLITPVEFHCHFRPAGTTIAQIADVIEKFARQNSFVVRFEPESLGSHQLGDKETFFIIVSSPDAIKLREMIAELPNKGFKSKEFYPHITIGFTDRDLHSSDGVIKDEAHSLDKRYKLVY